MPRCLLLFLALSSSNSTLAPLTNVASDTGTVLITSGLGIVSLTPTRAVIRINVATRDSTASAASLRNSARLRRVVDSLNANRQRAESVQVVGVSVGANEDFDRHVVVDYEASAVIRVAIPNLDRLGAVIDVAVRSGATGVENIEFRSDREDAARSDALARAFAQARSNALALAKAAGSELGPLLRLSTEPETGPRFASGARAAASFGLYEVPITPNDIQVTASVTATWRLRILRP